jgi:hypothetical protein
MLVSLRDMIRSSITPSIAPWIAEALALEAAGMPEHSFSLTLHSPGDNAQTLFDIMRTDALWQDALEEPYSRGLLPRWRTPSEANIWANGSQRGHKCHFFDGFPRVMEDIMASRSIIRFENCVSEPWSADKLVEENKFYSSQARADAWEELEPQHVQTQEPLPRFIDIMTGHVRPLEEPCPNVHCPRNPDSPDDSWAYRFRRRTIADWPTRF